MATFKRFSEWLELREAGPNPMPDQKQAALTSAKVLQQQAGKGIDPNQIAHGNPKVKADLAAKSMEDMAKNMNKPADIQTILKGIDDPTKPKTMRKR